MSENTKIEWCDHTFNPWTGCAKVSPGCANCYAEGWAKRSGIVKWGKGEPRRRTSEIMWKLPLKWNRDAANFINLLVADVAKGLGIRNPSRPRVFCASLADWLDDEVPIEWLADLLNLIRLTPNIDWLLLSKRPEKWRERIERALCFAENLDYEVDGWQDQEGPNTELGDFINQWTGEDPPSNVWIGTTVEDQRRADERIRELLKIPAKVRFLSCEPLLEAVDFDFGAPKHRTADSYHAEIHWVITGGESGNGCRPFDVSWARSLRDQCADSGVAFFMKQMGGTRKPFPEIPDDLMIREFPLGGAR